MGEKPPEQERGVLVTAWKAKHFPLITDHWAALLRLSVAKWLNDEI